MTQTRSQYQTDTATAHTNAEFAGAANLNTGVATINSVNWSRVTAKAALSSGAITQNQFNSIVAALAGWEQAQVDTSFSKLRNDSPDPLPR